MNLGYGDSVTNTLRAVLLSVVLLLSTVAPFAATAAAASTSAPDGFVGVPAENVGPPDHANAPDTAGPSVGAGPTSDLGPPGDLPTSASTWDVLASDHAGDLTVEVGTTADGRLALRLGDSVNHAGREVAVDAETLVDALGYRPEVVSGLHESGERWTATVEYDGSHAVFRVPRFSTNTVTFDAAVSISASPAEDGDTFTYDVSDADAAENLSVTLTGRENTESVSTSAVAVDGDTVGLDVGGTTDPRNATVTFTGRRAVLDGTQVDSHTEHTSTGRALAYADGVVYTAAEDGSVVAYDLSTSSVLWSHSLQPGTPQAVEVGGGYVFSGGTNGTVVGVDASTGAHQFEHNDHGTTAITALAYESDGNKIHSGDSGGTVHDYVIAEGYSGGATYGSAITDLDVEAGTRYTVTNSGEVDGGAISDTSTHGSASGVNADGGVVYTSGDDAVVAAWNASDGSRLWTATVQSTGPLTTPAVEGDYVYTGGPDGVVAFDRSTGSVAWSHTQHSGVADLAYSAPNGTVYSLGETDADLLAYQDRRETEDPSVDLDGDGLADASVSGVLADGETVTRDVSLSTSTTSAAVSTTGGTEVGLAFEWTEVTESVDPEVTVNGHTVGYDGTLADGATADLNVSDYWIENGTNNVSVGVSQVSDGPPGMVGLDYSHRAVEDRSVAYGATAWSETYEVSKTWGSDVDDATLAVPWASSRVVSVRSVTVEVNGTVRDSATYASENGTLTVDVGPVAQGETVNVSATGSKVRVSGGSVTVTNATEEGLDLDTEARIDTVDDAENFSVAVGGTASGHLLHYVTGETWTSADDYLRVSPDGSQVLHLSPAEGGTFTVRTAPVEAAPEGEDVEAVVLDAGEPRFRLREAAGVGEADSVEITYYDTRDGQTYQLYSETEERGVDTATASSPVTFLTDGDSETYSISLYDSPSASGDGAAVAVGANDSAGFGLAPAAVVGAAGLAVVAAVLLGRRFGVTGTASTGLLAVVGLVVAVVAGEAVTRGSVVALVVEAFLDPVVDSQIGVVAGGIGLLLGVYAVNERVGLPWWVLGLAVAGDAIWVLDEVTGGALSGGLGEVSALLWLVGIFGGFYLLYTRLKPRDIVING